MKLLTNKRYKHLLDLEKQVPKRKIDKLTKAMALLEELGCHITDIESNGKLIVQARIERETFRLEVFGTQFDAWLDKKDFPKERKDLKNVEGMMYGIRFRREK